MSKLNADSARLLKEIFPRGVGAYVVTGRYNAQDKLQPGPEGPAGLVDLKDDHDAYYCVAEIVPGKDRTDGGRVRVVVIDDVGKEIPRELYEWAPFLPEPSFIVESSAGSFQYGYILEEGMDPDDYRALRRAMKASTIYGRAHNTGATAIYRLPQGAHTKSTRGGFRPRVEKWGGIKYREADAWASVGGAPQGSGAGQGSVMDLVEDEALLRALVALIPNPAVDWDFFVDVGRAIWGASLGLAAGVFEDWAAQLPEADPDVTAKRWDSYASTGSRIGRHWLLREARAADPAGAEAWLGREAAAVFATDPVDVAAAEAAVVPMFTVDDFRSVVGEVDFVHVGTGKFWKAASVDAKVPPMPRGQGTVKATAWMRAHRYVTELSWLPGKERIVENCSMGVMGLERRLMHSIFNLYLAPDRPRVAEEVNAEPWCDLVRRLWPYEAKEIFDWFAHRVQRPGDKCNHALVLGGAPGIGKDTVLEAVRRAVGVANCHEILPNDLRSSFNDYVKSVMLVVNELRDDGQLSQYAFYDKSKTLIAAPPYTATINSKYLKTYVVPNVCGVVMTTNYKQTGMYLPADDRRHLVCWSDAEAIEEGDTAFAALWAWLEGGGFAHVAAWLWARDISGFDAKAPPRKTQAFQDIVAAGGSTEERSLRDKIEKLGRPKILRIVDLKSGAQEAFDEDAAGLDGWLTDHKFRKVVAEALDRGGYRQLRNPGSADGRWRIGDKKEFVYGRKDASLEDMRALVKKLSEINENGGGKA